MQNFLFITARTVHEPENYCSLASFASTGALHTLTQSHLSKMRTRPFGYYSLFAGAESWLFYSNLQPSLFVLHVVLCFNDKCPNIQSSGAEMRCCIHRSLLRSVASEAEASHCAFAAPCRPTGTVGFPDLT